MAEMPQDPSSAEPFDVALSNLVQALVEGGATPREAVEVAKGVATSDPRTALRAPRAPPQREIGRAHV